jgi:transcriptional regulator with PAS, ATPase and Fis domain
VPVALPPLRDRRGDVPLLLQAMIERHGGGRSYDVARSTLNMLERYSWPGNVRELENSVQRAIALAGSGARLEAEDLLPQDGRWRSTAEVQVEVRPLREVTRECEVEHIKVALEATGGHRSQTAELLGISRKVLWEKLRDFGIDPEESGDAG